MKIIEVSMLVAHMIIVTKNYYSMKVNCVRLIIKYSYFLGFISTFQKVNNIYPAHRQTSHTEAVCMTITFYSQELGD